MQKLYKSLLLFLIVSVSAVNYALGQCTITGLNSSYCVDDPSVTLSGGTNYFGPGVFSGVFYPSIAGASTTRPHKVFTTNGLAASYTVSQTGTFSPYTFTSPTNVTVSNSSFTNIPIGFSFIYFGTTYTTVNLYDNGFIKFSGGSAGATAQTIPSATNPNNEIAFAWNDLNPSTGTIRYQSFGISPLRVLVIEYNNVQFLGGGDYVNVQIHLFETSNHIEIHSTHNGSIGVNKTMGIENNTGSAGAFVIGRNNSIWTADNDFVAFLPACVTVKEVTVNALPGSALTVSPASTTTCSGNTVGVTIGSSVAGINYQLLNSADNSVLSAVVAGTGANLTITSSALASNTVIKVHATNAATSCDVDLTNTTSVTVNIPPQIAIQPAVSQTICVGQSATFTVDAGTTTSPTYQWRKGGSNIGSATGSSYTIPSVAIGDAGTYDVVVSGTCAPSAISNGSVLNVNTLPIITTQPTPAPAICEGGTASFSVVATGTGLSYQWKKNGINIGGATTANFSILTTTSGDAGTYTVVVKGTCDVVGVTSTASVLIINEQPEITVQPSNQTSCAGGAVSFTVNAGVTTVPTYVWKENGSTITNGGIYSGATSSTLTLTGITAGLTGNGYTVVVGGTCTPTVTSSPAATLTVNTSPVITTPPVASQPVCEGGVANFSVVATGTGLTYQWRKNGVNIGGATSSTYSIPTTVTADAGTYTVVITGTCTPAITSTASVLIINEQPEITVQPSNQTSCAGGAVSFTVNAGVTTVPTYVWKENGSTITNGGIYSGATSSTLTLTGITAGLTGNGYTVVVGGTCTPTVTSSPAATLTVNTSPVITTPPVASQPVCEGGVANFSVVATGTGLTYQWRKNGVNIGGATSSTYSIPTTVTADAGTYTVVITGTCTPAITSTASVLIINEQPEITVQPSNQTSCAGGAVSFTVNAGVTTVPTYVWKENGSTITNGGIYSGATSSTLTLTGITAGLTGNGYTVVVGGTCTPTVTSSPAATLTVNTSPVITTPPVASQPVCEGGVANFSVVATGTGLTYQWRKNGVNIGGATSSTYSIPTTVTADAGTYTVVITGTCTPAITSTASVLIINEQPEITVQPSNQTSCAGGAVSFTVNAGVTTVPTYVWKENGSTITNGGIYSGATSSTLTLTGITAGLTGNGYTVVVGGTCTPTVTSSPAATLTVNTSPVITTPPVASQPVCEGGVANFSVVATGTGLTYQWRKNGVNIGGATSSTYSIPTTVTADAGTYTVVITGTCTPAITSTASVLIINEQPEITVQPSNQTSCAGGAVSFTVNAGVTTVPTYVWKENGSTITNGGIYSGATSSTLTLTGITAGLTGNGYTVVVGGTCTPTVTSSPAATLTVNTSPVITTPPVASQPVCEGGVANFSVVATGTGLTYQWRKNGVNIGGATSSTYSIPTTVTADAGTYTVVITGTCTPAITSTASVLIINEQPEITVQPSNQTSCAGGAVSFTVNAGVTTVPTYVWKENGSTITNGGIYSGATSSTLTLTGITAGLTGNGYTVVVGGTCTPTVTSSPAATLTVNTSPVITTPPVASQPVCEGGVANFSVVATGTGLTYQWRKNGVNIGGATSSTYSIPTTVTADAGTYTVVITGTCTPAITSTASVLIINEQPEITVQPSNQTSCAGGAVSFTVNAGVTTVPTYVWKENGSTITNGGIYSGATSSTLTLTGITAGLTGNGYTVVVGGTCTPTVTSSPAATLTVNTSPVITTPPVASQPVCEGGVANFSVVATGTGLTYQWRKNGVNIGGATSSTYSIPTTVTADAGTYTVVITGTCTPAITSTASVLIINEQPEITVQPSNQTSCAGGAVSFTVNAGVTTVPTYVWKENGSTITNGGIYSGATSSTLTLTGITAGLTGNGYTVVVGGTCTPTVTSSPAATLTVNTSPVITTPPVASQPVCEGGVANFSVVATGTGLTYQWRKNGVNIGGATSSTYSIPTTVTADAGTYTVVITGTCTPAITSTASVLIINEQPEITVQPSNQTSCAGGAVSFTVNAGVTTVPTYVWKENGSTITNGGIYSGATSSTLTLTGITAGLTGNGYTVVVGGTCTPTVTSSPAATLTVNTSPVITTPPVASQPVCEGGVANFSVVATGTGLTYQWRKNGVNIGGATSSTYSIPTTVTADAGTYTVVITGTCTPAITSTASVLIINEQPEITVQPVPMQTLCVGISATFSVNAGVTTGATYQWRKGGTNILGATNPIYTIASIATTDAGTYDVIISGTCTPPVTSNPSVLNVNVPPTVFASPQTVCSGQTTNVLITNPNSVVGTTYIYTVQASSNVTGATGPASVNPIAQTLTSTDGNNPGSVTYQIIGSAAGCSGPPFAVTVSVNPVPTVSASDNIICSGSSANIALSNPNTVANTSYSWAVSSSFNVSGAGIGSGSLINQILNSTDGISNGFVIYSVTPSAAACPGMPITVRVDVKPVPAITTSSSSLSPQICSNVALNFTPTASIAGTTYTWLSAISGTISAASVTASGNGTITDTPVNTGNTNGTVTYRITPHFNGCDGLPIDYVVTVKPLPSATAANTTICSGQNALITISSAPKNVAGTTYVWTASGINVSGFADGNGSTITQILNTTTTAVGTATYSITPTAAGCSSLTAVTVTASVNPFATVNAGADYSVCQPTTIVIMGSIEGSATSGIWSKISGGGTLSSSMVSGTTVTATYTVNAGSDIGTSVVFRLTTNDPDGVGPTGPCLFVSDDLVIDIHRQATVTVVPTSTTLCEPSQIILSGTLGGSATTGSWTLLSGDGTLAVSSVTGSSIVTADYFPDLAGARLDVNNTVSFRLTTNDPDGSGPCVAVFADKSIKINESAKVDAGADFEVCEDKAAKLDGLNFGFPVIVTWSGGTGGFSDIHDPKATYTLGAGDISAGSVTLRITAADPDGGGASGPCGLVFDDVKIIINKLPLPQIVGLKPIYAENDPQTTLVGFSSNSSGGTGDFTGLGIVAGTSIFDPSTSGTGIITITYTFTDNKTCIASTTASTTVNPVTSVDFDVAVLDGSVIFNRDVNGYPLVCANQGQVWLVGTPPNNDTKNLGADFTSLSPLLSISHIGDQFLFDTDGLPVGSYKVQYSYTNEFGANNKIIKDIIILSAPVAKIDIGNSCFGNAVTFNESSTLDNLSGGTLKTWSWLFGEDLNGSSGSIQEPTYTYTKPGSYLVTLTVISDQGCANTTKKSIVIGVPPTPNFTWKEYCNGDVTAFTNGSTLNPAYGTINSYGWDFGVESTGNDTLGISSSNKIVPPGKHSGRTGGTWQDPTHKFGNYGIYSVNLTVGTNTGCTATVTKRVFILQYTTPIGANAYAIDFENGPDTWVPVATSGVDTEYSWQFGTPGGAVINKAKSGINAWWTGTNVNSIADHSNYLENENSFVIGPCLDLTSIERPMISMDYWSDTQVGFDGAVVQYSTNGGDSWETIGDAQGAGINWYSKTDLLSQPGGQDNYAWSDTLDTWINARYNLDKIPVADRGKVVVRVAFASNNDNPSGRVLNGFAFDNIYIGEKKRNVLVEHFTNTNDPTESKKLDQLFDEQTTISPTKKKSDFFKIEYHLDIPGLSDSINEANVRDSRIRAFYYGVTQPPYSVMDGISGSYFNAYFNGTLSQITKEEIDRRALEEPLFEIALDTGMSSGDQNHFKAAIKVKYVDSLALNNSVVVRAALIEREIGTLRNVVKKLLPTNEGVLIKGPWDVSRVEEVVNIDYNLDVHFTNPDSLSLVVFVQNNAFEENPNISRRIHQAQKYKLGRKTGMLITGIENRPPDFNDITIYPNPAHNTFNFVADRKMDKSYSWELVDQRGMTVLKGKLPIDLRMAQPVDVASVANGIYFVKLYSENGIATYKKISIVNEH